MASATQCVGTFQPLPLLAGGGWEGVKFVPRDHESASLAGSAQTGKCVGSALGPPPPPPPPGGGGGGGISRGGGGGGVGGGGGAGAGLLII
jgi:hypothetical protein